MILDKIEKLLDEVQNLNAHNAEEIEALRLKYLSKKGEITTLMALSLIHISEPTRPST